MLTLSTAYNQWVRQERERCIDRSPAWFVAFCAMLLCGMIVGLANTGSLFYSGLSQATGYSISSVAWISTAQAMVIACPGPLYNWLLDLVPQRPTIIFSVLVSSSCFFFTSYLSNYFVILSLYTIIAGIGMGICFVKLFATIADYFTQYSVLGIAICSSGGGLGTLFYSKFIANLIDCYTWRPTMMLIAAFHLNVIPLAIALRPLPPQPTPQETVLIPGRPDLMTGNQEDDNDRKFTTPQRNLFISLYSMNSAKTSVTSQTESRPRSRRLTNTAADRVRVVIEFIRVRRSLNPDESQVNVHIEPSVFVRELSPVVRQSVKRAATPHLMTDSLEEIIVYIPIVYLLAESPLIQRVSRGDQADLIAGSTLKNILRSQNDLLSTAGYPPDSTRRPLRMSMASLVSDSFASSTLCMTNQRQIRQALQRTVKQADKRVQTLAAQLRSDGNCAVPQHPVMVLIDSASQLLYSDQPRMNNVNRVRVLGYQGTFEKPIMEEEFGHQDNAMHILTRVNSTPINFNRAMWQINRTYAIPGRSTSSEYIKSRSNMLSNRSRLSQTPNPMFSIQTPDEAVQLLKSRVGQMTATPRESHQDPTPKCSVYDPLFLCLLFSRFLACVSDSIFMSHIALFAPHVGFSLLDGAGLISWFGLASLLTRLVHGCLLQFIPLLKVRTLATCDLFLSSLIIGCIPFSSSSWTGLMCCAILFGATSGPAYSISAYVAYQLLGPVDFSRGIPFVLQVEKIGFLVGGPIGGILQESKGSYMPTFLFAAACSFGSTLCYLFLTVTNCSKWRNWCHNSASDNTNTDRHPWLDEETSQI